MPDLPWRNDGVTTTSCPVCRRAFAAVGRQRFCSAACRQASWRQRHPTALPLLAPRVPRRATVYACPTCDARYLGDQRCPECNVFCTRVGPGGLCPHCDEPVALIDLLEGGAAPARSRDSERATTMEAPI